MGKRGGKKVRIGSTTAFVFFFIFLSLEHLLTYSASLQFGRGGGRGGGRAPRQNYQDVPKQNEKLETFYNELGAIPEEEKEEFWEALRRDLPSSFRFTGSRGYVMVRCWIFALVEPACSELVLARKRR